MKHHPVDVLLFVAFALIAALTVAFLGAGVVWFWRQALA